MITREDASALKDAIGGAIDGMVKPRRMKATWLNSFTPEGIAIHGRDHDETKTCVLHGCEPVDANEYTPWVKQGKTELQYWKDLYLELRSECGKDPNADEPPDLGEPEVGDTVELAQQYINGPYTVCDSEKDALGNIILKNGSGEKFPLKWGIKSVIRKAELRVGDFAEVKGLGKTGSISEISGKYHFLYGHPRGYERSELRLLCRGK